jgi:hypothetical protein
MIQEVRSSLEMSLQLNGCNLDAKISCIVLPQLVATQFMSRLSIAYIDTFTILNSLVPEETAFTA